MHEGRWTEKYLTGRTVCENSILFFVNGYGNMSSINMSVFFLMCSFKHSPPSSLRVREMRNWTGCEQLFLYQRFIWPVWLPKLHLVDSQHFPALVRSFIHFESPECTWWDTGTGLNLCSDLQNNTFGIKDWGLIIFLPLFSPFVRNI